MRFFYSGQGNKKDGAMCFKDGEITCEDFFKIVEKREDIEGNDLYITLDSSYAHHWTLEKFKPEKKIEKMKIKLWNGKEVNKADGLSYCNDHGGFLT